MSEAFSTYDKYRDALNELQIAQQNFNAADPEHVDIAILQLKAAELRVGVVLREVKDSVSAGE